MSVERVARVEEEAGLTEKDTEVLRGVRLLWQKLSHLRQQALKDDKYAKQYHDLLVRGIAQARAQQAPEDDEAIARTAKAFWDWYDAECESLGIRDKERDRGSHHQAWCAKWLAGKYAAFHTAITRTFEEPTQQHYDEAKAKASAMLTAYVEAFKGR